jgi:DNA-binding transcriptional regulator YiaG
MTAAVRNSAAMTGKQMQALLHAHGLRHADVARLLDVSVRSVESWHASKKISRVVELALLQAIAQLPGTATSTR